MIQSIESTMLYIETQDSGREEEANLLHKEASTQIGEASKKLKAVLTQKAL